MRVELIISTYNSPRALRLALLTLPGQVLRPDSVCIADDGSGPETKAAIDRFAAEHPDLNLGHVWHPNTGFEKNAILNRAVASSDADLLIFTDGDCLLSPGFVARHVALAGAGRYACGSLIRLPAAASAALTEDDVVAGRVFDRRWLRAAGAFDRASTWLKSAPLPLWAGAVLERLSPVRRTWSGSNASAMYADILRVNGFDEAMKYGGEDKEFGIRLRNAGLSGRHLRYSAPVVHIDHPRGYVDRAKVAENRRRIAEVRRSGRFWTADGVAAGPPQGQPRT